MQLNIFEKKLLSAIQNGLPLTERPYHTLAEIVGISEEKVISTLESWQKNGFIKRFGLVVQHHKLGYQANAMVVWDIPDEQVDKIANIIKQYPEVTLCYRRTRQPQWPYNLYCMIHGQQRQQVQEIVNSLIERYRLNKFPHSILFSTRQFKQRGAKYNTTAH